LKIFQVPVSVLVPCGRLSWLTIGILEYVIHSNCIVSYHMHIKQ